MDISKREKADKKMSQTQAEGAAKQHAARLGKLICEHIIRVLQHQKDVNQKQHICVKHDFVPSYHNWEIVANVVLVKSCAQVPMKLKTHCVEGTNPVKAQSYDLGVLGVPAQESYSSLDGSSKLRNASALALTFIHNIS
ncbi:hypothetical protein TNCV_4290341 [Trichonephila clavipes]|nr:hypothetical protein TNCV_4290341 [Trichonephila clavipes]